MKIAVFGLGYVGSVTATLLAERGHHVLGVDIDNVKTDLIKRGICPVLETGLPERLAAAVERGQLTVATEPAGATDWRVAFVCVATPSGTGGQLDTSALEGVLTQIGQQLKRRNDYAVVAIRSTTQPHILRNLVVPTLTRACGVAPGDKYGVVVTPEFLREGAAVTDFLHPAFTLVGESDRKAGDVVAELFEFLDAPLLRMGLGEAVMVKYASNAYHALKVAFANEIGLLCARDGVDAGAVMEAFCKDTKLNISASYLKPGFAFGGSCLPKDLRALNHRARQLDVETPVLNAVLPSNRSCLESCVETVLATDKQRIGIFGMSFKPGTDDLRESPMIALIENLIGKGKQLAIYDRHVRLAHLIGTNRAYLERAIPHISSLMKTTIEEVIAESEVLVVGYNDRELRNLYDIKRPDQILLDLSGPRPVLRSASISLEDIPA
jgi:GDP-mannose 6-dehydrogenase